MGEARVSGTCYLCRRAGVRLVVDHNHKTGMIRDYICQGCNVALGEKWEDPKWRARALEHLERDSGLKYSNRAKLSKELAIQTQSFIQATKGISPLVVDVWFDQKIQHLKKMREVYGL